MTTLTSGTVWERLDKSRDFSAGWNSALWEVVKECIALDNPTARQIHELCRELAHTPPADRREVAA